MTKRTPIPRGAIVERKHILKETTAHVPELARVCTAFAKGRAVEIAQMIAGLDPETAARVERELTRKVK